MAMKLTHISTLQDVKTFVHILMEEENLNFHPDTPFEDYIFLSSEKPVYSKEEAGTRNNLLNQAFKLGTQFCAVYLNAIAFQ
jgi:hypothetical protein